MQKSMPDQASSLRLRAMDEEDLAVLSAHLQDAILRVADIAYLPKLQRFGLECSRFDWHASAHGKLERCRTRLHFESVRSASCHNVPRDRPETPLVLLAVTFEPGPEPPSGVVLLVFSGGAKIRLEVECLEAQLADMDGRWAAARRPTHA